MAKLIDNTVVVHPQTGEPVLLVATGELPDWAVGLVGDHLLEEAGTPARPNDETPDPRAPVAQLETATARSQPVQPKAPPRSGPGSAASAWRDYAGALEVEVPDDASRDDCIAALEAAGEPTE